MGLPGATFPPMIVHYAHSLDQEFPHHAIERVIGPDEITELAFYLMRDAEGGEYNATF